MNKIEEAARAEAEQRALADYRAVLRATGRNYSHVVPESPIRKLHRSGYGPVWLRSARSSRKLDCVERTRREKELPARSTRS